jgi:amino-acid N-acetyltransferase
MARGRVEDFSRGFCRSLPNRAEGEYHDGVHARRFAPSNGVKSPKFMASDPPNSPAVRSARAADAEAIAELIGPFVRAGKLLPRTATEIRDLIPTGFVAEAEGKLVGFTALEIYSPKLAEIRSLAVGEGQQRLGLGKQLVAACVELARKRNILEVMVVTSSEEFFQSCGFDFTLPGEKKALFIQPTVSEGRASSTTESPS